MEARGRGGGRPGGRFGPGAVPRGGPAGVPEGSCVEALECWPRAASRMEAHAEPQVKAQAGCDHALLGLYFYCSLKVGTRC